jgi:2-succinyl-6-hydroxy-2,4-cyclohexadiene-1-carboxylate synthase
LTGPPAVPASALAHTVRGAPGRPAAVFLHGFMGSSEDWREVAEVLSAGRYCVAVDLPGHGGSVGLPPEAYTMEGAARAVIETLDERGVGSATFVGYSMGGRLALYLALRRPERCAGLFLESASPGLENAAERAARRGADGAKAARLESGSFEEFVRDWYRQPLFASLARDGELLRRTIGERLRNDPSELAKSLRGMGAGAQPSLWGDLAGLRVPSLAVAGELDAKFVAISRRMAALAHGMRAAVVPDAGHNVRVEAPVAYLALLRGFLEES